MSYDLSLDCKLPSRLLDAVSTHDQAESFLAEALQQIRRFTGAEGVAVVESNPPLWSVVSQTFSGRPQIPTEVAAEALDKNRPIQADHWIASPISQRQALVVLKPANAQAVERSAAILAPALKTALTKHQRLQRIRRLETMLEITHRWNQTNCTETLLTAMAEAATDLLVADRASIFLWDKANHALIAQPALGMEEGQLRLADTTGIVGQVVRSGLPRRIGEGLDADQIDRTTDQSTGYQTNTILCVPLTTPQGECLGAFEVLNKQEGQFTEEDELALTELAAHAAVALESTQQFEELLTKHQQLVDQAASGIELIGESPAIEAVRSTIGRIADTDLAILILGENGTGKEVVAQSIHYQSSRREQPWITVNCAALPDTLLESELFGHEKGAFTDAHQSRIGMFELASGGTLFLDEIGDMSLSGQAKLLRVLEDKTIMRVGGSQPIHTEVRILAATNQDLITMVREKKFREDLFFRLHVVCIDLPPLRDRQGDILQLATHFLRSFCNGMGRPTLTFSSDAKKRLLEHSWPGNVRELRNLTERLAYLTTGNRIEAEDLAFIHVGDSHLLSNPLADGTLADATRQFQQNYIRQSIVAGGGNMTDVAKKLGLHRSNLYRKMRQLGMEVI